MDYQKIVRVFDLDSENISEKIEKFINEEAASEPKPNLSVEGHYAVFIGAVKGAPEIEVGKDEVLEALEKELAQKLSGWVIATANLRYATAAKLELDSEIAELAKKVETTVDGKKKFDHAAKSLMDSQQKRADRFASMMESSKIQVESALLDIQQFRAIVAGIKNGEIAVP